MATRNTRDDRFYNWVNTDAQPEETAVGATGTPTQPTVTPTVGGGTEETPSANGGTPSDRAMVLPASDSRQMRYGVNEINNGGNPLVPQSAPTVGDGLANTTRITSAAPTVTPEQSAAMYDGYVSAQNPLYKKDAKARDGGFFNWLGTTFGTKAQPGEDEEARDYRVTQGKKRMMLVADMLRHFGNIVNTSKYAPAQTLVTPYDALEKGYQARRAARKAAETVRLNRELKEREAERTAAYRNAKLGLDAAAAQLARDKFGYQQAKDKRDHDHKIAREGVADAQWKATYDANEAYRKNNLKLKRERNSIARAKGTGSGGSSGGGGGTDGYVLATPNGMLTRKKAVADQELGSMLRALQYYGLISSTDVATTNAMYGDDKKQRILDLVGAGVSRNSADGERFRSYLQNHHGFATRKTVDPDAITLI